MQFWNGADHGAAQQRLEVPVPGLGRATGLRQVDAGIIQPDGSELQPPAEERGEARHGFERPDVGDRLDADRRISRG